MILRNAKFEDLGAIATLLTEGDRLHHQGQPQVFSDIIAHRTDDCLTDFIEDPQKKIIVAEIDGSVVGAILLLVRRSPDVPIMVERKWLEVENLIVSGDHRRHGIATILMQKAEEWGREQDIEWIELSVWMFNRSAIELYDHMGFDVVLQRMRKNI
jgi:ribosomal protein S18 acetylase RimI-like enzyme